MVIHNYSVEASVYENGKTIKGTLMMFSDEFVFNGARNSINWEMTQVEEGIVPVKSFLRTVNKPCIVFVQGSFRSSQFMIEPDKLQEVRASVRTFADETKKKRAEQERAELEKKRKEEQRRIEEQKKKESEQKKYEEQKSQNGVKEKTSSGGIDPEIYKRQMEKKQAHIRQIVDDIRAHHSDELISVCSIAQKAGGLFLDNPYRVLGISCSSSVEDANKALDKLKKLNRLKALDAYRSEYDLNGLEKPVRDLSVAQNALTLLKDISYKWFWFSSTEACTAWNNNKYRAELTRNGPEYGTYDLFLANYMYAVLCDPDFNMTETWKRVLNYCNYILDKNTIELLKSRFCQNELSGSDDSVLYNSFKRNAFKPILMLCERDDLDAVLRFHKIIISCENEYLEELSRIILGKLVSWFTEKEAGIMGFLKTFKNEHRDKSAICEEIRRRGEAYCDLVEPMLTLILKDFKGATVRYDMIKESYSNATYQLMYELYKLEDMSNAIYFANKCYSYCKSDDKKRIKNTFGEANIKAIDWRYIHTVWDAKGDKYFFGRGCPVDYAMALYWYRKAADAGNMYSPNSIGICYQKGLGVPKSEEQAAVWFEKSCKSGCPEGAYNLAECYYSGTGVKKDIDLAIKYWGEAAKLGHPAAKQKRDEIFTRVQAERKIHRAHNHICHDIGFQMTTGPGIAAEVTLNRPANVYLVNQQGYQKYLNGIDFAFYGGHTSNSPYRIRIPTSNHWYIIVDNGDQPITGITSSVKVTRT